jgi:hypothetical protein
MRLSSYPCSLLLLIIAVAALSSWAHADMRVIESNSKDYPAGSVVADGTKFDLGPGCHVRVLNLDTQETMLFQGRKAAALPIGGTRGKPQPPPC